MLDITCFLMNVLQIQVPELLEKAEAMAKHVHFPKGAYIIRQGDPVDSYLFLASDGIVRCVYHTAAGKEITECFVSGAGSCVMPSAIFDQPSPIDMEAVTDVDMIRFPLEAVKKLEEAYPEILAMENRVLTEAWRYQWELKRVHYELSAEERYLWFMEQYPNVMDHVLDRHIASFLDMTPVTLSRIRRKLAESKH